ncbi:hypothetical protein CALVIDRAFT_568420 [Calocera viscosa TUFC12733]|uniref:Uncharacterized protein n=1 Tax=Calocera viscosa (strain TUFC12733) TaxID=1330018 RepID=A0A167H5R8_CALVF|nr:hypothetical protein CALVIDRAFT_568420 [Calocera viscosa TUFC12733]
MALTPVRPLGLPSWPATSSPDPISMLPPTMKRAATREDLPEPAPKRRKLSPEPESDASTRTTPSMVVTDAQVGGDATSELSDMSTTPTPLTEVPATFYVSEPAAQPSPEKQLPKLPDALLLLMIPQLVLEPPSSPNYVTALYVSWLAMRRCLRLDLTPEVELRALAGQAEVGLLVLDAQVEESWVKDVAEEAEKGIGRGITIATAHPTLAHYIPPLSYLQVRLAVLRGPTKRALNLSKQTHAMVSYGRKLRRNLASLPPS